MKRVYKSPNAPTELSAYISKNPAGTVLHSWEEFCDNCPTGKKQVQRAVKSDQRGLCAYCEIDLVDADGTFVSGEPIKADFQIEHFHPKCDKGVANRPSCACDWGLYWPNMYGCCSGGSERLLADSSRFGNRKSERHCGARKRNKVLDNVILNPSEIPASPCLFMEDENSTSDHFLLAVNSNACRVVGVDVEKKADATIKEFNLNCTILTRRRRAAIRKVFGFIQAKMNAAMDFDQALEEVVAEMFDNSSSTWPTFFTAIRIYFSPAVESRLKAIGFNG